MSGRPLLMESLGPCSCIGCSSLAVLEGLPDHAAYTELQALPSLQNIMPKSSSDLQYQVFGPAGTVYPGHALTLAYLVMLHYPSYEAAAVRRDDASCPDALSNSEIPGAGGCVYSALDLLKHGFTLGVEEALEFGDRRWEGETETAYKDRRQPGQAQADAIKDKFRERFARWPREAVVAA